MEKRCSQIKKQKQKTWFSCFLSSAASSGTVDTSSRTHIKKGAPTCSSSSWSTFAKVLGELVSSLVGFVTALASHHRSSMNAMFAHEFTGTDIERQQSLNAVVMNTSSFSNFFQHVLAQRDTEVSMLKQLPSRPSHLWHISPARQYEWEGCVSRYFVSWIGWVLWATVEAASTSLALLVSTRRLLIRPTPPTVCQFSSESHLGCSVFLLQVDKGRLGDLIACRRTVASTMGVNIRGQPARLTCTLQSQVRWRPVGPRGYQGSCPGGSSDAVDVIDPADKVQMTSSDETSRQMCPLTRSSGMLCVACCYAHELDSQQWTDSCPNASESLGTCGCFQWWMGRLRCFSMYTVHLSIDIMFFCLARQQLTVYPRSYWFFWVLTSTWLSGSILSRPLPFFVPASYGPGVVESSSRNVMVEVLANSVAWSRRVFSSSGALRICIPKMSFGVLTEKKGQIIKKGRKRKNKIAIPWLFFRHLTSTKVCHSFQW